MHQFQLNHSTIIFLHIITPQTSTSVSSQFPFFCNLLEKKYIQISSTDKITSSELQATPLELDTINLPPIQTYKQLMPHKLAFKLLYSQTNKSQADTICLDLIKLHHANFKASLSKPHSVSIHKTPMTIPFNKPSTFHFITKYYSPYNQIVQTSKQTISKCKPNSTM